LKVATDLWPVFKWPRLAAFGWPPRPTDWCAIFNCPPRVKACKRGYSVIFATIQHLASQLSAGMADLSIEKVVDRFVSTDLVVFDELGFTPLNRVVADHYLPHRLRTVRTRRDHNHLEQTVRSLGRDVR
jgi:hypothetical protein